MAFGTAAPAKAVLDVTNDVCPLTWVKTKLALEVLACGAVLEVRVNSGEPMRNVPRSAKEEGHRVLSLRHNRDDTYTLWIEKDGLR